MADLGSLITIAENVSGVLQSPLLKDMMDYKSDIENLSATVLTIKNMLLDADRKGVELSHEQRGWIERLKDALYDADDLFDECVTLAKRQQANKNAGFSERFFQKVRDFFSSNNPVIFAYNTSQEVKNIRENLDAIASDHERYGFKVDSRAIRKRKNDTCSYVHAPDVIGREGDLSAVIDMLLFSSVEENMSFLTIVGVGGLGKTTLAQLVYNDKRIISEFPMRLWICVSDQDGEQFDLKAILCKILESATGDKPSDSASLDSIISKFQQKLEKKKYLLVLDDVWNEDHLKWVELRTVLRLGGAGSRILVTTRSKETARAIGDGLTYDLNGLSPENCWDLFKMVAFDKRHEYVPQFFKIGKKIVEKCSNVPLAIKVVGSLLYGQNMYKWRSFEVSGVAGVGNGDNHIMSILKVSYRNLEPSLKSCFSYCALFPKDFEIEKEMLISLWMAQQYIVPFDRDQSIEDAGKEHFSILLRRCFFQDVKKDEYGNVKSFKVHDLMHDLAQLVAGNEIFVVNSVTNKWGDKIRHIFEGRCNVEENCFTEGKLRSYLQISWNIHSRGAERILVGTVVKNWVRLRALGLKYLFVEKLPDFLGELLHLRYLNLSDNSHLQELPGSITKLHNLQTLDVSNCPRLKKWPKKFSKLVNLSHLYINGCEGLASMPVGIDKLHCLCVLTDFVVADESASRKQHVGQLKDLIALVNLKGRIDIHIRGKFSSTKENVSGGGFLEGAEQLKAIRIGFPERDNSHDDDDKALMEKLMPHPNLKEFEIWHYAGAKFPRCGSAEYNWAIFLPSLVKIVLNDCERLQQLPLLSKLQFLKYLELVCLQNLEYMEDTSSSRCYEAAATASESGLVEAETFFPSLESLLLFELPKLKGWWRSSVGLSDSRSNTCWQPSFPRLFQLTIHGCPDLTSFPPCPSLATLGLKRNNTALKITTGGVSSSSSSLLRQSDKGDSRPNLRVDLDCMGYLSSLPAERLASIEIYNDVNVESLSEAELFFRGCSSLRRLEIYGCSKLRSLSRGLEHLTALESLVIEDYSRLDFQEEDNENGIPWRPLHHNLRFLRLVGSDFMKTLPKGMQYLTSLQHLEIGRCDKLKALPKWISCLSSLKTLRIFRCQALKSLPEAMLKLTSLQKLELQHCPDLIDICQKPSGKDWPKIQQIPEISIIDDRDFAKRLDSDSE